MVLIALLLGVLLCPYALFAFAPAILHVEHKGELAEVIIILGGESGSRVLRGAELFHSGMAPIVILSGYGGPHRLDPQGYTREKSLGRMQVSKHQRERRVYDTNPS